jgi:hypothetical protein
MTRSWNGMICTSSITGEERAAAPEAQAGQGVAGEHPEDDGAEQHATGDDHRVEQRLEQVHRGC